MLFKPINQSEDAMIIRAAIFFKDSTPIQHQDQIIKAGAPKAYKNPKLDFSASSIFGIFQDLIK